MGSNPEDQRFQSLLLRRILDIIGLCEMPYCRPFTDACDPNQPRASAAPALSAASLLIASDRSIGAMPQLVQG